MSYRAEGDGAVVGGEIGTGSLRDGPAAPRQPRASRGAVIIDAARVGRDASRIAEDSDRPPGRTCPCGCPCDHRN